MEQEEKELLLKDLCARLPYGVKVQVADCKKPVELSCIDTKNGNGRKPYCFVFSFGSERVKPYLRSMDSMTEEERKEYKGFIVHREHVNAQGQEWDIDCFCFGSVSRLIDWLNAHHFDYRGLIEKGLAIEVTEVNNPYKD